MAAGRRNLAASGDGVSFIVTARFGGNLRRQRERIRRAARHVKREVDAGNEVSVVSAMSGKTKTNWPVNDSSKLHSSSMTPSSPRASRSTAAGLMAINSAKWASCRYQPGGWQVLIHTDDAHGAARTGGRSIRPS